MPVITNSLGSTKVTTLDVGSNGQYTNTSLTANAIREAVTAQGVSHIRWRCKWGNERIHTTSFQLHEIE